MGDEADGRVDRVQLSQGLRPVAGVILGPGIAAAVSEELFRGEIKTRHGLAPQIWPTGSHRLANHNL